MTDLFLVFVIVLTLSSLIPVATFVFLRLLAGIFGDVIEWLRGLS